MLSLQADEEYAEATRDSIFQFILNTRMYINSFLDRINRMAMSASN
jgi:hypothetical protein